MVGAIGFPELADLAYLTELDAVPVRRNSSDHLENSFFDFVLADARSLVTRYRKSPLSNSYRIYSTCIEAFARESRNSQTRGKDA